MPENPSHPPQSVLPARIGRQLATAKRREADARRLRAEAAAMQAEWDEYQASKKASA